jgi:hypothetical protein
MIKKEELDTVLTSSGWNRDDVNNNYYEPKVEKYVDLLNENEKLDRQIIYEITGVEVNPSDRFRALEGMDCIRLKANW